MFKVIIREININLRLISQWDMLLNWWLRNGYYSSKYK